MPAVTEDGSDVCVMARTSLHDCSMSCWLGRRRSAALVRGACAVAREHVADAEVAQERLVFRQGRGINNETRHASSPAFPDRSRDAESDTG